MWWIEILRTQTLSCGVFVFCFCKVLRVNKPENYTGYGGRNENEVAGGEREGEEVESENDSGGEVNGMERQGGKKKVSCRGYNAYNQFVSVVLFDEKMQGEKSERGGKVGEVLTRDIRTKWRVVRKAKDTIKLEFYCRQREKRK